MGERPIPPQRELVHVPWGANRQRTSTVLLGSALEKGYSRRAVKVTVNGFLAPQDVVDLAFSSGTKSRGRSRSRESTLAPTVEWHETSNEKE